jgi:peptidoglycan LD-endopeptidase LytH
MAPLDLTKDNKELDELTYSRTEYFTQYIENKLRSNHARYLVGGYAELREMYKRSVLFDYSKDPGEEVAVAEPRRLHLGTDIWGPAGTPIYAPLGGMVHSIAYNNNFGDYGATIILQHQLETQVFHTLYGHLALADIESLAEGQFITRCQRFAQFGPPAENGQWPPHLHFQIIIDMEFKEGDYPGVCKNSERDFYLSNCPDADLVLNINRHIVTQL